jgi:hypothetical protein
MRRPFNLLPMSKTEHITGTQFQGFRSPNTTPIPDEVFDELLADLSGAEVKVLLYICRRTFGWKKESDNISLNQMLHGITRKDGTQLDRGIGLSKPTLLRTIKRLTAKQIVLAEQRASREKGHEPTNYRLNVIQAHDPLGQKMSQGESQKFTKPLVKKSTPQETVIQETVYKTVNGDASIFRNLPALKQPKAKAAYMVQVLLEQLGDAHSARFYRLLVAKIPEAVIRQALAEIKADGARHPARLFTYKVKRYTLQRLKERAG